MVAAATGSKKPRMARKPPSQAMNSATGAGGGAHLLLKDRGRVMGMAGVGAVVAEAADRMLAGELQERALVEADGARRRTRSGCAVISSHVAG